MLYSREEVKFSPQNPMKYKFFSCLQNKLTHSLVMTKFPQTHLLPLAYHTRAASSLVKGKLGMPGLNEVKFGCQRTTSNRFFSISVCNCRYTGLTIHIGTMDVQKWVQRHKSCQNPKDFIFVFPSHSMHILKFNFRQQTAQDHLMHEL